MGTVAGSPVIRYRLRARVCAARPLLPVAHGPPARRRRPHGALQLAVRAPARRASWCCASRTPTRRARTPRRSSRSSARCAGAGSTGTRGPGVGGPHEPYLQSERRPLHLAAVDDDARGGHGLPLLLHRRGARRRAQGGAGGRAADGLLAQVPGARRDERARRARGRRVAAPAIRLAIPEEGEIVIDDLVRGEIRWENALLGDNVIVRSDGDPDLQPREPARRRRDGHHARDPRRRPAAVDARARSTCTARSAPRSRASRTSR